MLIYHSCMLEKLSLFRI